VTQPHGDELWIQSEALRVRVRHTGEMLEANKRNAARIDDQFTGVRGADTDHQHDVVIGVRLEQLPTLRLRVAHERHDVGALQHGAEIAAVGKYGRTHDVGEMRTVGVDHVVVPVRLKQPAVALEEAAVGGDSVRAVENCEEIRQQVDQHFDRPIRVKR